MNYTNKFLIGFFITASLFLMACVHTDTYIKNIYNELDKDIAKDYKRYADFDEKQQQEIDRITQNMMAWHRQHRLPELHASVQAVITGLESQQVIETPVLMRFLDNIGNPMAMTGATDIFKQVANFAYQLNDLQVEQIAENLTEDQAQLEAKMSNWKMEKENKKIAKIISGYYQNMNVRLNNEQKQIINTHLQQRVAITPKQILAAGQWNEEFILLLNQRKTLPHQDFTQRFVTHWEQSETIGQDADIVGWQYNQTIMAMLVNDLLITFDSEKRNKLIEKLKDYAQLIDDLIQQKA